MMNRVKKNDDEDRRPYTYQVISEKRRRDADEAMAEENRNYATQHRRKRASHLEYVWRFLVAIYNPGRDRFLVPPRAGATPTIVVPVSVTGVFVPPAGGLEPQLVLFYTGCGCLGLKRFLGWGDSGAAEIPVPTMAVLLEEAGAGSQWVQCNIQSQVQLSPQLYQPEPAAFYRGRIVRGIVNIYSSATSATSAAIAGQITAANLADTFYESFDSANILAQAIPSKDQVAQVPVQTGVVFVVGPDWKSELDTIPAPNTDPPLVNGAATGGIFDQTESTRNRYTTAIESKLQATLQATPYENTICVSARLRAKTGSLAFNGQNITCQSIGLLDTPVIELLCTFAAFGYTAQVTFVHVYAQRGGTDGLAVLTVATDEHPIAAAIDNNDGLTPDQFPAFRSMTIRSQTSRDEYKTWVASFVVLTQDPTYVSEGLLQAQSVNVIGQASNKAGHRGPVRAALISPMPEGQSIVIAGQIDVECEPTSAQTYAVRVGESTVVPGVAVTMTQRLFNNSQWPCQRVMNGDDFKRISKMEELEKIFDRYTQEYPEEFHAVGDPI